MALFCRIGGDCLLSFRPPEQIHMHIANQTSNCQLPTSNFQIPHRFEAVELIMLCCNKTDPCSPSLNLVGTRVKDNLSARKRLRSTTMLCITQSSAHNSCSRPFLLFSCGISSHHDKLVVERRLQREDLHPIEGKLLGAGALTSSRIAISYSTFFSYSIQ